MPNKTASSVVTPPSTTEIWSYTANTDDLSSNFTSLLDKDLATKGSWRQDYEFYCSQFNIIPCPFIKSSIESDSESCRVANCIVDLSSWRAMLLACCTVGSKVCEISVHASQLSVHHLTDLSKAIEKSGLIRVLKLQYLSIEVTAENSIAYSNAIRPLFNDTMNLEYISIKGNNFGDEFVQPLVASLCKNFRLKFLNLSGNVLSDVTVLELFSALRLTTNLTDICLADNNLSGDCLNKLLAPILLGNEIATADDEAIVKANTKYVTDRNKNIKETNKKRKKAGYLEWNELALSGECIVKKDGKLQVFNRSFKSFDFSRNTIQTEQLLLFVRDLKAASDISVSSSKMAMVFKGLPNKLPPDALAEMVSFNSPWVELVLDSNMN